MNYPQAVWIATVSGRLQTEPFRVSEYKALQHLKGGKGGEGVMFALEVKPTNAIIQQIFTVTLLFQLPYSNNIFFLFTF